MWAGLGVRPKISPSWPWAWSTSLSLHNAHCDNLGRILGGGKMAEDMRLSQQLVYLSCIVGPSQMLFCFNIELTGYLLLIDFCLHYQLSQLWSQTRL